VEITPHKDSLDRKLYNIIWKMNNPDWSKKYYLEHQEHQKRRSLLYYYNNRPYSKIYKRMYNHSIAGKLSLMKYKNSDKGKEATSRHQQSDTYKETKKRYAQSDRGKTILRKAYTKFYHTEKGKLNWKRKNFNRKIKKLNKTESIIG
jgi:hypothetical protein